MTSFLNVKEGIYDPSRRFEFTNVTSEPFTFTWNSSPITVKAGEKVELPHHLAVLATTRLVDQIMSKEIHDEEVKYRAEMKDPYYRSPRGISMGVPAARDVYEKKILRELAKNESKLSESAMGIIRSELKETLTNDLKAPVATHIDRLTVPAKEFEEINLPMK